MNQALGTTWQEWKNPRELPPESGRRRREESQTNSPKSQRLVTSSSTEIEKLHADWWTARIARQTEIDKSIAAKAEFEFLYDKPYENKKCVRVAGPFTVESQVGGLARNRASRKRAAAPVYFRGPNRFNAQPASSVMPAKPTIK